MSARRLKRSVKRKMHALPQGVKGRGPKQSMPTRMPFLQINFWDERDHRNLRKKRGAPLS